MKKHFNIAVAASFILFLISCSPSIEKHISILKDYKVWYKLNIYEKLNLFHLIEKTDNQNLDLRKRLETYSFLETFVDEHENALVLIDTVMLQRNFVNRYDNRELLNYTSVSAKKTILEKAKETQLVLINEAHHRPEHRAFTSSLLADLYAQGYRYFALEGLTNGDKRDSLINQRGYPLMTTGYYSKEVMFSNMLREAMNLGFELIAYEAGRAKTSNERDSLQALNIYNQTFAKDPNAKVVVHAGYGHIIEEIWGGTQASMGFCLKRLSGINPLTIDQTNVLEIKTPACTTPLYGLLLEKNQQSEPIALHENGNIWNCSSSNLYDMSIIHPPFKKIDNRPAWLIYDDKETVKLPYSILKKKNFGRYVEIYLDGEEENTVPVDRFILSPEKTKTVVGEGNYRIVIKDKKGKIKETVRWTKHKKTSALKE